MTKRLDRPFARYDAQFWQDDRYMAMPRPVRNEAYLYLLAVVGYCRARRSRGVVAQGVADGIARFMELNPSRVQRPLLAAGLLQSTESGDLEIPKYDKWQDTPEEIAELSHIRAGAGRHGGANPKQNPSNEEANAKQNASKTQAKHKQTPSKRPGEREREVERELLTPLPLPPPRGLDGYRSNEIHHVSDSIGDVVARARARR